ncbi:hypothetical protein ACS0TY_021784 [Phlomoides rotata]
MDLRSTNKTFINDEPIEPHRYYEMFEKDTIKICYDTECHLFRAFILGSCLIYYSGNEHFFDVHKG